MRGWKVLCPAKLNLFLSVGPPEPSGYHPIRTIFQSIGLFDELRIEVAEADSFTCDSPEVPPENTVTRALRLVRELVDLPPLKLELHKHIPSQAGLGGGSSDAAGLLRAAEVISAKRLPPAELAGLARAIGADVPFFLIGGRARGEGHGEILTPVEVRDDWFVVAKPADGCDTAGAYRRLDALTRDWRPFPAGDEPFNDFEAVAPESDHVLLRAWREAGFSAGLTGSGSAVFAQVPDEGAAHAAREIVSEFAVQTWIVPSLRHGPRVECEPKEII